jgi:hypothetical protein
MKTKIDWVGVVASIVTAIVVYVIFFVWEP